MTTLLHLFQNAGTIRFDGSINVANVVALLAVLATLITLLNSNGLDRKVKRKQYADQIRNSAASLTAKLERWRDLTESFFEEIQPAITDADGLRCGKRDLFEVRDKLWRDLWVSRLGVSQRVRDEEVELAYAMLYGYDENVRDLFLTPISRLKSLREVMHHQVLLLTQHEILGSKQKVVEPAELGNRLRKVAKQILNSYSAESTKIIDPFRSQMMRLIAATDEEVAARRIALSDPKTLFHAEEDTLSSFMSQLPDRAEDLILRNGCY
jgi:hypothetical protein